MSTEPGGETRREPRAVTMLDMVLGTVGVACASALPSGRRRGPVLVLGALCRLGSRSHVASLDNAVRRHVAHVRAFIVNLVAAPLGWSVAVLCRELTKKGSMVTRKE